MAMEMMKEALAKRRGKEMESDAAPEAEKEMSEEHGKEIMEQEGKEMGNLQKLAALVKDIPEAAALVAEMIGEQSEEMGKEEEIHADKEEKEGEEEGVDEEMVKGMSDYEKEDVIKREKPRSLFERAQKESLLKLKK